MAGIISNKVLEEIKDRIDIVDLIGRYVDLKKAGSSYKGLCPFHNEKTPSFVVSPDKQIFTCFGCEKSGDAITFMQEFHNMDFSDAVETLADEAGVTIVKDNIGNSEEFARFYDLNREAAIFFYKNLRRVDNRGLKYMENRGLNEETLRTFGIGWADDSWNSLYNYLKNRGYDEKNMMAAGLISYSKERYYDKFRERVIFPIQNRRGKVIGFGGRAMGDDMPKYLNSPETIVFKKKDNLYGLNVTSKYIGKLNQVILVEGYMDVISLYQAGVRNVTASLGTALTDNQAKILSKMAKNVVISYDSDEAGISATLRAMDILKKNSCHVSVAHAYDAKDPDEFIKKFGREKFLNLISEAKSFGEYKLDIAGRKYNLEDIDERIKFMEEAVEILRGFSKLEREIYAKYMSRRYGVSEDAILSNTESGVRVEHKPFRNREKEGEEISSFEKTMIKIFLTESRYLEKRDDYEKMFETTQGRGILRNMIDCFETGKEINYETLSVDMDLKFQQILADIDKNIPMDDNVEEIYSDCIKSGKRLILKRERDEILSKLSLGTGNEQAESYVTMSKRLKDISFLLKE